MWGARPSATVAGMHRPGALALLVTGLVVLPAAAQAKRADLTVRSVSAPAHATPDQSLDVQVQVSRTARTRAAKVGFYISTDRRHDAADTPLGGDAKVAAGGPTRKLSVAA